MFDWRLFCASEWLIEHRDLSLPEDAANLFTPWYALADGSVCSYDSAGALISSVSSNQQLLAYHNIQASTSAETLLTLPAYELKNGAVLLLDGNHRAVSTHLSGAKKRLALFIVCGPLSINVLPDLRHWA